MSASRQIFCLKILNPHMGLLREIQLEIEKRSLLEVVRFLLDNVHGKEVKSDS